MLFQFYVWQGMSHAMLEVVSSSKLCHDVLILHHISLSAYIAVGLGKSIIIIFDSYYTCIIHMFDVPSREFDENLLRSVSEIFYEDEVANLPLAPDVSNYLMPEVCHLCN